MDLLVIRLCDAVIHQYQEDCIYIYTYTVKISCGEISERVDLMVYCKQNQTNCAHLHILLVTKIFYGHGLCHLPPI